tara:strand:+ start:4545 stop:5096 length:552 start_codon:yes stop_codon:yes gene_type:complete
MSRVEALTARLDRPIALVGLMGTGKSSVGRRLAEVLGRSFVDADDEIEQAARLPITEIFAQFGEDYFRDGERRVIARLVEEDHGVIATGGGAFINAETRALILDRAVAVWIDCDLATLVERTGRRDNRPLLRDGDSEEILARLMRERTPYYRQAHIRVEGQRGPHLRTAWAIIEGIEQWLSST